MATGDYEVIISRGAGLDITETIEWYETQRKNLGFEFALRFEEVIALLQDNPYLYQEVILHFRKVLMQPFSYAVYYQIDDKLKEVLIIAVIHQARGEEYIQKRLAI